MMHVMRSTGFSIPTHFAAFPFRAYFSSSVFAIYPRAEERKRLHSILHDDGDMIHVQKEDLAEGAGSESDHMTRGLLDKVSEEETTEM